MTKRKLYPTKITWSPRVLIGLLLMAAIFLVILWPFFSQPEIRKVVRTPAFTQVNLPQGWVRNKLLEGNVRFSAKKQFQNETDFASVVLIKEPIQVDDPDSYTYKLIMGAYKTIPSLSYTKDYRTTKNGLYLRDLEGKYSLGG